MDDWEVCLEVDGKAVGTLAEMKSHLVWGGPWAYDSDDADPKIPYPETYGPNNCGVAEGTPRELVSWGFTFVLKPLPPGQHTIRWYVVPSLMDLEPRGVTYDVTVE